VNRQSNWSYVSHQDNPVNQNGSIMSEPALDRRVALGAFRYRRKATSADCKSALREAQAPMRAKKSLTLSSQPLERGLCSDDSPVKLVSS
jgi:hypothetical protein